MNIAGIILNFMATILIGNYGPAIEEDLAVYEVAYSLRAELIGEGAGPHYSTQWLNGVGNISERISTTK